MDTDTPDRPRVTLVWIDAREAIVVRRRHDRVSLARIESDVPVHHRATGHIRHDPMVRHGGGGPPQTAGEPHRLEHLDRFLEEVARQLPADDELAVIGPGTVHERFARRIRRGDRRHGSSRRVRSQASMHLTDRQLVARLRELRGETIRRPIVGGYRWSGGLGAATYDGGPRRVIEKPPRGRDRPAIEPAG